MAVYEPSIVAADANSDDLCHDNENDAAAIVVRNSYNIITDRDDFASYPCIIAADGKEEATNRTGEAIKD